MVSIACFSASMSASAISTQRVVASIRKIPWPSVKKST